MIKQGIVILCAAGCLSAGLQAQIGESTRLEPGKVLERQLAGVQSHEYLIALETGQYAKLLLDQNSINVVVACFGPDGMLRFEADSVGIGDTEIVELIGDATGMYRFRVAAAEPMAPPGRYSIVFGEITSATERHRSRIAAARAFSAGRKIAKSRSRTATVAAIPKFEEALRHWRDARDTMEEARTLLVTGLYTSISGDQSKAWITSIRASRLRKHLAIGGWRLGVLSTSRWSSRIPAISERRSTTPIGACR
jgi:hypothetical protein